LNLDPLAFHANVYPIRLPRHVIIFIGVITDIYKVQYIQKVQNDNAYKVLYTKILTTISARRL